MNSPNPEKNATPPTSKALKRLLELAYPQRARLVGATLFLLLSSGLSLSFPQFLGTVVDHIAKDGDTSQIDRTALILIVIFALMGVATAFRSYLFSIAGERIVTDLRIALYRSLISQDIGFFDAEKTGDLVNRLSSDTTVLQNAVTVNLSMALRFAVTLLGALIIMAVTSWRLTMVMLLIVPVVALGGAFYGRMLRAIARQVRDSLAEATAVAEESLSGVRTVRAFAREPEEQTRYNKEAEQAFSLARRRARLGATFHGVMSFAGFGAIAGVLWYGGRLVTQDVMTFGQLAAFILYTFTLAFSLTALSSLWTDFARAVGATERVFELLGKQPEIKSGTVTLPEVNGQLKFDKVTFSYPTRPAIKVLQDFDLTLSPGDKVALVGPSGGGKSTVAALLSRFYDPDEGQLRLDDQAYDNFESGWLREQIGIVSQEPVLFSTTIAENILYGRPAASREDVIAAAKAANAHDFIIDFPEAYDTLVGERGVRLSGGQKQRVAIARAILKDPSVLILDEATSALDAESEHLVQEALDRLEKGRTTLIIAHRLSTVKNADRVVVLDRGRIVQVGSHRELVHEEGLYRRLVKRQFAFASQELDAADSEDSFETSPTVPSSVT